MFQFLNNFLHEFELPLQNPVLVFSLILIIILLSPILLKKLNIPGIIGLIISGVIIGPNGFNILEKNSAVDLFSTIGLLYIMFIAGLELDMNEFKVNRNKSYLFGFFTFIIPLLLGFPVCYYFLDYDFNASLLTASMFSTHTLVTYPIVSKFGISKNQAVAVSVGGTIIADTAVLIILAVIIGNSQGNLTGDFWITLAISIAIFTAIMFYLIPKISAWFFKKLISEKYSHYIFVLSVVFFSAFLAEVAGMEAIIGAFFAGLALNKLIPHSSALMNRIDFIGNSIFIPFFLISVGMLVNVSAVFSNSKSLIILATLTSVALISKWFAAHITQIIFKYSAAQRLLIFGLSSSRVAATLAVILVGYKLGILDANILNGTIFLILITCIVASFVTEAASKKIVLEQDDSKTSQKYLSFKNEHILLPIANMANIEKLLEFSILIRDSRSPNPVSILSVVSNDHDAETNILKARNKLEQFVKQASASETRVNILTTIDHNAASGISRISRETMTNIIVLGWPQKAGFLNKLIGEKVDSIVCNTSKTTFICSIQHPLELHKRILVAAPPLSEFDPGFELWLTKINKLAQELSIPIRYYCNANSAKAIKQYSISTKTPIESTYSVFEDWSDFINFPDNLKNEDLIILISARKSSASHMGFLDHIPHKMEKIFVDNSKIIVYPEQPSELNATERY